MIDQLDIVMQVQGLIEAANAFNQMSAAQNRFGAVNQQLQQNLYQPGAIGGYRRASNQLQAVQAAYQGGLATPADLAQAALRYQQQGRALQNQLNQALGMNSPLGRLGQFAISSGQGLPPHVNTLVRGVSHLMGGTGVGSRGALSVLPFLTQLAGAAVVVGVFTAAAKHAADALNDLRGAAMQTGGNAQEVANLHYVYGFQNSQIGNAASSLAHRLASDPWAAMASANIGGPGMIPPPELGGAYVDQAKLLEEHVNLLRRITNAEQRLTEARRLGLESILNQIMISEGQAAINQVTANTAAGIADPFSQSMARDFMSAISNFGASISNFVNAIGNMFIPILTFALNFLSMAFNGWAMIFDAFYKWFAGNFAKLFTGKNPFEEALKQNTNATNSNTAAMLGQPGIYGGGARGRNAVPPALKGEAFRQAMQGQTLNWGGWYL